MTIHFLNCGTMRPYFPRVKNGVTCLLVETNQGPVLIDTGFGTRDYLSPNRSMHFFLKLMRSPRDITETALQQVQRLGFSPGDIAILFKLICISITPGDFLTFLRLRFMF